MFDLQAAAVEGGQDPGLAAEPRIVHRGVRLVAVEVERPAPLEVQGRDRMQVVVVAAAHDGALAAMRHDERQGGFRHLPVVHRDPVLRRHVDEHPPEPVVRHGGQEIGHDAELGARERGRDRVAAERDRVVARHRLLVPGRDLVGQEGHVDIGLTDEEGLHDLSGGMGDRALPVLNPRSPACQPARMSGPGSVA